LFESGDSIEFAPRIRGPEIGRQVSKEVVKILSHYQVILSLTGIRDLLPNPESALKPLLSVEVIT